MTDWNQPVKEGETPCPICQYISKRSRRPTRPTVIRAATHGAGGPGYSWSACYEHYEAISAFEWLRLARKWETKMTDGDAMNDQRIIDTIEREHYRILGGSTDVRVSPGKSILDALRSVWGCKSSNPRPGPVALRGPRRPRPPRSPGS